MKQWYSWFIPISLAVVLYCIAYFPILQNYFRVPTGYSYLGFTEYPTDVIENLSIIQQGYAGQWHRRQHYSGALPKPPFYLKFEYLVLGHVGKLLQIEAPIILQLGIFFISIVLLSTLWWVVKNVFQKNSYRFLAWVFCLFATGISGQDIGWGRLQNDLQVFQRITFTMPHYLLGSIFCMVSLVFFAKSVSRQKDGLRNLTIAIGAGMLMTHIFVPNTLLILSMLCVFLLSVGISSEYKGKRILIALRTFYYGIGISLPVAYLLYASNAYGRETYIQAETLMPVRLQVSDYIDLVGVPFFYSLVALPFLWRYQKILLTLFASWFLAHPVALFMYPSLLGFSQMRFLQGPYFVFISLLAVKFIEQVDLFLIRKKIRLFVRMLSMTLLVLVVFLPSKEAYRDSFNTTHMCYCQATDLQFGYPKMDDLYALRWLNQQGEPQDIVLTEAYIGGLLPALTTKQVYVSWWLYVINQSEYNRLYTPVKLFYSGLLTENDAREFIRSNHIAYVYYGNTERWNNWKQTELPYTFLEKKLQYQDVIVYQIKW